MKTALLTALLLLTAAPEGAALAAAPPAEAPGFRAADDRAVRSVVFKYDEWRGGPAFAAMSSIHEQGALETAGLKGTAERWAFRDGREKDAYDLGAFTGSSAVGPDGGWSKEQGLVEDLPSAKAREARRQLMLDFDDALHGRGGAAVARLPDEPRDGRTWAVLRVTFGDADTYDAFIDADTGELHGWRATIDRKEAFTRLGDWRMVDGVRMPFLSEELHANPGENVVTRDAAIELNRPVEATLLERPQTARLATFAEGRHGTDPVAFEFFNGNRIYIPATVAGRQVKVLLDSGADVTTIDKAFADAAGLQSQAKVVANGTGGQQDAGLIRDLKIQIGGMTVTAPTAAIIDLSDVQRRLGLPMPVIFGAEVFKQLIVDIDFSAHTIAFHEADGFTPPKGAVMVPVTMTGTVPSVPASIEGGPPVQLDFDIGNGSPLLIFPAYWQAHAMLDGHKVSKTRGGAVGGLRDEYLTTVKSLTFAGVTFHDVPTILTTPGEGGADSGRQPGNIGLPIYSRFRMITDYPHGRLWLVPNAQAIAAPFRRDRGGLSTAFEGDHLKVIVVASGSPAEAAGWKADEVITAIDGRPIDAAYPGSALSQWGYGEPGRKVTLTAGDGRSRTLELRDYY